MSVLIKGMEMPINCEECPCFNEEDFLCQVYYKILRVENIINRRADFCPLVELPPHGDLIDRNALMKKGMPLSFSVQKWVQEVDIVCAPTVIPAEEGE